MADLTNGTLWHAVTRPASPSLQNVGSAFTAVLIDIRQEARRTAGSGIALADGAVVCRTTKGQYFALDSRIRPEDV